jgi:endonuclease YncB( thermonuclease family)
MKCARETVRVRLLNVNTPERGEDGFGDAKTTLEALMVGREFRLEFERPKHPAFDKYDRLLVYVMDDRGQNVNVEMVRAGMSCFYRRFGKGRFPSEFERAEREAAAEGRRDPPCA